MNPYEVLGVDENADEETIKKAYRELVKKYHPDKYVNNPLSDLAAEKMKEINKAYDMLTNKGSAANTRTGYGGSYGGASYNSGGGYGEQASFQTVRSLLARSQVREAMAMLEALPRTAEWYYLSGRAHLMVGWYDQGISFLRTAVNMDPDNQEYRDALGNVESRNRTYTTNTNTNLGCGCCDPCAICTALSCCSCCFG